VGSTGAVWAHLFGLHGGQLGLDGLFVLDRHAALQHLVHFL
jgi:hypothetical protein